jgi:hypothetical protein
MSRFAKKRPFYPQYLHKELDSFLAKYIISSYRYEDFQIKAETGLGGSLALIFDLPL